MSYETLMEKINRNYFGDKKVFFDVYYNGKKIDSVIVTGNILVGKYPDPIINKNINIKNCIFKAI